MVVRFGNACFARTSTSLRKSTYVPLVLSPKTANSSMTLATSSGTCPEMVDARTSVYVFCTMVGVSMMVWNPRAMLLVLRSLVELHYAGLTFAPRVSGRLVHDVGIVH